MSKLSGTDNYGKPRQDFADKLTAASDEEFLTIAERCIWLSAYAANNPRSDYHWQARACADESGRRGSTGPGSLYDQAWQRASA